MKPMIEINFRYPIKSIYNLIRSKNDIKIFMNSLVTHAKPIRDII